MMPVIKSIVRATTKASWSAISSWEETQHAVASEISGQTTIHQPDSLIKRESTRAMPYQKASKARLITPGQLSDWLTYTSDMQKPV